MVKKIKPISLQTYLLKNNFYKKILKYNVYLALLSKVNKQLEGVELKRKNLNFGFKLDLILHVKGDILSQIEVKVNKTVGKTLITKESGEFLTLALACINNALVDLLSIVNISIKPTYIMFNVVKELVKYPTYPLNDEQNDICISFLQQNCLNSKGAVKTFSIFYDVNRSEIGKQVESDKKTAKTVDEGKENVYPFEVANKGKMYLSLFLGIMTSS